MANLSYFAQQKVLDALNLGSTTGLPTGWWVAISTASPVGSASAGMLGEFAANGYTRQSVRWGAALGSSNVAYSAFNTNAMTFGPFTARKTASGVAIMDASAAAGAGNPIMFGLLAVARVCSSGDTLVFAASALTALVS